MLPPAPLPDLLPRAFRVADAANLGVSRQRVRNRDLDVPFHGLRSRPTAWEFSDDPWQRQAEQRRVRASDYLPRMKPDTFFSHETAAAIWGAPLPYVSRDRIVLDGRDLPVHVSVLGSGPLPRGVGVRGHRADGRTSTVVETQGIRVASPATMWASLGTSLSVLDLVAVGDYLCRMWREGHGRPTPGLPPIATRDELEHTLTSGRRVGAPKLRRALALIREDSWSPKESQVRCVLVEAGLPEPELNIDVFDESGRFLGCVDMAYRERKIAIEYQSVLHAQRYSADVERIAALRAAGWIVIEVTAELLRHPAELVARVRRALRVG